MVADGFDPAKREAELRAEAESWDVSATDVATLDEIPVIDVGEWFRTGDPTIRDHIAGQLGRACETVGFWQLVGHGVPDELIDETFAGVREFHALPDEVKLRIRMDQPDWPVGGVGYLPLGNRKLPRRTVANENEAFIMKRDAAISLDDNQWPDAPPNFRDLVSKFSEHIERLALGLLPLYATALGVEPDWFAPAFTDPFWRLRLTHYPAAGPAHGEATPGQGHGINPHVDTTFFTLLLQDSPGLTIHHAPTDRWLRVPVIEHGFVVNSGELLRTWTNDRYLSVRHFADAPGDSSRYSIPFFFNANADYQMQCVPTCESPDNPAKYPPISYAESQAVAQGE